MVQKEEEIIRDPGENVKDDEAYMPKSELTGKERRWFAFGATMSALLIGMVYIVGFGLVIALMLFLWT